MVLSTVFGAQAAKLSMVFEPVWHSKPRRRQAGVEQLGSPFAANGRPTRASGAAWLCIHAQPRSPGGPLAWPPFTTTSEHNLKDIIDTGLRGGAKVVVSTVARNLKDCGSFASDHRPGLSAEKLSRWDGLYQVGSPSARGGPASGGDPSSFQQAAKLDDSYAGMSIFR